MRCLPVGVTGMSPRVTPTTRCAELPTVHPHDVHHGRGGRAQTGMRRYYALALAALQYPVGVDTLGAGTLHCCLSFALRLSRSSTALALPLCHVQQSYQGLAIGALEVLSPWPEDSGLPVANSCTLLLADVPGLCGVPVEPGHPGRAKHD